METPRITQSPILVGLMATATSDWRGEIAKIGDLKIDQLALLLRDLPLEGRRALYRVLEATPPRFIPYVQLAADSEEWELRYLMTKYQCNAFSLPALESSYAFIQNLAAPLPRIFIENPEHPRDNTLFNNSSLERANVSGVCLDAATLERNRLRDIKDYEAVIASLDHCAVGVAIISPVTDGLMARFSKPSKKIESLKELRYLKHFPPSYFNDVMVLCVENLFEEQLEIITYLETLFRKKV